jgi:hypothetical protein
LAHTTYDYDLAGLGGRVLPENYILTGIPNKHISIWKLHTKSKSTRTQNPKQYISKLEFNT